jgi:hypothetical protein
VGQASNTSTLESVKWATEMILRFLEAYPPTDADKRFAFPRRAKTEPDEARDNAKVPVTLEAKLREGAKLFRAVGRYLGELSTEVSASGKKRGRPYADPKATLALRVLVKDALDSSRPLSHNAACRRAAERLADQEGVAADDKCSAMAVWAQHAQADTRQLTNESERKRWRPGSVREALLADDVRRGKRIGVKVPKEE